MIDSSFSVRHSPQQWYLVGVSGGVDSVVLLDALVEAGYRKLVICHLNHGLRGRGSGQDAAFVRRLGTQYGFAVEVRKVDAETEAEWRKVSLETAGRELRYEFFAEMAANHRCPRVLLAHHADDQVETVLMNLFRGAGLEGLEGMREWSEMRVGKRKLELIRPLLGVWREEIEGYAKEAGMAFREDPSNAEPVFLRNRVRHQLMPSLKEIFGRDVRGAVCRMAEVSAEENAFFREMLGEMDLDAAELPVPWLRGLHGAVQRRVILAWLRKQGVADVGFREVEMVRRLLGRDAEVAKVNLPGGRHARRREKKLFLE